MEVPLEIIEPTSYDVEEFHLFSPFLKVNLFVWVLLLVEFICNSVPS